MQKVIDDTHPRVKVVSEDSKVVTLRKRPICASKTGSHNCCSRAQRKSDFQEYGVGTVLYFQFLKYMGCMFVLFFILAIPAMLFFFYGTELADVTFTKVVTAASLGNLGSSSPVCNSAKFDLSSDIANLLNP